MKKIVLSIAASFVSLFVSAQVTQSASDTIVLERMSQETRQYTLHAKEEVQTQYSITTSAGEELELDYPCRVYYVSYMEDTNISRYLIVKESNGNLLEVNTKNTAQPDNLANWRIIQEEPLDTFVLISQGNLSGNEGLPKQNLVIRTQMAWDSLINAMNTINNVTDSFADINIDFSKYQIIAVFDEIRPNEGWTIDVTDIMKYDDSIVVSYTNLRGGNCKSVVMQPFYIVKTPVFDKEIVFQYDSIEINIMDYSLSSGCNWDVNNLQHGLIYIINSQEELLSFIPCSGGNTPIVIDFDQYSLLFVYGGAPNGISNIVKNLQQLSLNEYHLNIAICLNDSGVAPRWTVALIVDKLDRGSNIELNVTFIY